MFKFITHKPLWVNILVVMVLVALLVLLFFGSLDYLTKHGEYEKVPSIVGKNVDDARKVLEDKGFEVQIQDSLYIDTFPKLAVIKQSPDGDATVKVNRTIYLTINRAQPPLVEMPNLVGFSLRNAEMYLQNLGLRLGDTSFRPDIAKNAVLEQMYNNQPVKAGTKIFMGSTISFVLGNGVSDLDMGVPDLMGKQFNQVRSYLRGLDINFTPVFDPDVTDSSHAYVTRQNPQKYTETSTGEKRYNRIKPGQTIDIWLSTRPLITADSTGADANASLTHNNILMQNITVDELKSRMDAGEKLNIIDVREDHERADFNIGGAHLRLGQIQSMAIEDIEDLKDEEVIIYCRSGNRSGMACHILDQLGFKNTKNVTGGMLDWTEKFGR